MEASGQLHAPAALPLGKAPGTHWIGGWVGIRAVLDAVVKRKISSPRRESNPRTPIVQLVAQRHTDWAITALNVYINPVILLDICLDMFWRNFETQKSYFMLSHWWILRHSVFEYDIKICHGTILLE
jgi:hypothetical protein